ncbi:MAG: acyl-CoA thioesterase [Hydrogenibacillus schlegelii]|uniref:Acyl-CoA hydrolase n=1 Tax=Hydrogenibacillus schlegelii TaxID=1484 RepID=A0A2T5GDM0_HYDSH|nr:acyl-CoA thioesterase [Hydrogenibacillus schlegelii]PTQ54284.1 MAG: Acyl-CoA hydrolase [Hydrogenibacillus schlegelii]
MHRSVEREEPNPTAHARQAPGAKPCRESRVVKTRLIFPKDTNRHGTLFGGELMRDIDDVAAIAAMRHSRRQVVTASIDSIDFLRPIAQNDAITLEAFVTWTGTTSMEVFVKVIAEDMLSGEREVAATAFATFVALDDAMCPAPVPPVYPETEEERLLYDGAPERVAERKRRKEKSRAFARLFEIGRRDG